MKKTIAIIAVMLLGLSVAACGGGASLGTFPMQGENVADLQPAQVVAEVAGMLGVAVDEIFVPNHNMFHFWLTGEFDWAHSQTITMMFMREARHGMHIYNAQLQIWPSRGEFQSEFAVTQPWRWQHDNPYDPIRPLHRLQDVLNALAAIPQEYIRGLFEDADLYMLDIVSHGIACDDHTWVFYNKDGVMDEHPGDSVMFSLQPMVRIGATGEHGHQGSGDDVIFLFFDIG